MGDKLKWFLKEGGGYIFESCDISLENMPTSHAVSVALVICTCSGSAMPLLSCTCLCNNSNGACLPLCWCFLLNITAHTSAGRVDRKGGRTFEREKQAPFATTLFKKGSGCIFKGGLILERLLY